MSRILPPCSLRPAAALLAFVVSLHSGSPDASAQAVNSPPSGAVQSSQEGAKANAVADEFARLDRSGDQRITLDEFLQRAAPPRELERDFRLYDFDASESLSRAEFASVSGLTPPWRRGPLPDPIEVLLADAVAALDQSYDHWNHRPNELVSAYTFVANFMGSISQGSRWYVTGRVLRHADLDADGQMSRQEARQFLEYQLGIRWLDGPLLREPSGRLVRLDRFLMIDQDRSNSLSADEFHALWPQRDTVEQDFTRIDRDSSSSISYAEYAHPETGNLFDPIEWFRQADTNLDASLDAAELLAAADENRKHLAATAIPAFDSDRDARLTLQEYRLSMLCHVNDIWDARPVDSNHDGELSYHEFAFHKADLFQLQRRYFFHRLDLNRDGQLTWDEFPFRSLPPDAIHRRRVEGGQSQLIYTSQQHPQVGWPSTSPDGTRILFHRRPWSRDRTAQAAGELPGQRIAVMNLDGQNVRDLCDGSQPSWSADGTQFSCARRSAGVSEVWVMNADGRSGQMLARGTAPRWSPDGAAIAYLHEHGIWVHDIGRAAARQVLARQDHTFGDLGDDIAWSPDSQRVAVLGSLAQSKSVELLIVPVAADIPSPAVRLPVPGSGGTASEVHLQWSAQQGIVFQVSDGPDRSRLVALDPDDGAGGLRELPGFEPPGGWKSACLTPDGKWYIAVSQSNPEIDETASDHDR
jgi:Ca2+-binding EF-hand superfamily protein